MKKNYHCIFLSVILLAIKNQLMYYSIEKKKQKQKRTFALTTCAQYFSSDFIGFLVFSPLSEYAGLYFDIPVMFL